MGRPNAADQKLQAVLYIMGMPLGRHGIDGDRGPDTTIAMRAGASRMGALSSADEMRQAIVDKLKDPKFRDAALEKLKEMPQNKDTIIAMQTVLGAVGHDTMRMRDPVSGMMTGKMNEATQTALANTEGGKPTAAAYVALGIPDSAVQLAMNGGKLSGEFQTAIAAASPAPAQAPPSPVSKVAMAVPENKF
jgi:hypothetical protein